MEYFPEPMTLGQWIPLWMTSYKLGTIKGTSYHQLELLARLIPDDLKQVPLADIKPISSRRFITVSARLLPSPTWINARYGQRLVFGSRG